jgi:putative ABC transport system permease protein
VTLRQDLRSAFRSFRANPGHATASLLTIALVVGAGSAVLAVASAAFIRPLPFVDANRLVWIYAQQPSTSGLSGRTSLHSPEFVRYRERVTQATTIGGVYFQPRAMTVDGAAESINTGLTSANYFDVLGVPLTAGRMFSEQEDVANARVAVLGDTFWRNRFGARADALGQAIVLDGQSYTIIGILAPVTDVGFATADVFTPLNMHAGNLPLPVATTVTAVARLAPGATPDSLSAELGAIMKDVAHDHANLNGWGAGAMSLRESMYGDSRPLLTLLIAAVAVLALIACANLTNVTLAGALGRRQEMTLRAALGAGRADIVRLLAIEQVILALGGGLLGVVLARWMLPAILALDPSASAGLGGVAIDWRVTAGALGLTLVVSTLSGVVPALMASRVNLARDLAQGGRRTAGSSRERRLRGWLVGAETLMASVLIAASALLISAFGRTANADIGFDPHHVLGTRIQLPAASYPTTESRTRFVRDMVNAVRALPGVESAGETDLGFRLGGGFSTTLRIDGRPSPDGRPYTTSFRRVGPGYFETMRIALVRGRSFTDADDANGQQVAIVSQNFADTFWPGEEAIGRRVIRASDATHPLTVIGIAANVRDIGLGLPPGPTLYIAHAQNNTSAAPVSLVVRTTGDPSAMIRTVTETIHRLDASLALTRTTTIDQFLDASLAPDRFRSVLLVAFAAVGLVLAGVGIFGVTSRGVVERTREMGVRLALGSGRRELWLLVVRQAMKSVLAGLVVGIPATVISARLMSHWLPNVTGADAFAAVPALAVLGLAGFAAAAIPAIRAARVDPMVTLSE